MASFTSALVDCRRSGFLPTNTKGNEPKGKESQKAMTEHGSSTKKLRLLQLMLSSAKATISKKFSAHGQGAAKKKALPKSCALVRTGQNSGDVLQMWNHGRTNLYHKPAISCQVKSFFIFPFHVSFILSNWIPTPPILAMALALRMPLIPKQVL